MKYLVKKQFALDSDIYNEGDIVEIDATDAKSFVEGGKLEEYVEQKSVQVEVDTKGIADAVREGLASFAPKAEEKEEKMGFGEFLQGVARKTINTGTDAEGGYAVTELVDPNIDVDLLEASTIASRANVVTLTGTNALYKKNVIDSMGTAPAVTAECDPIGESTPNITQFTFTLQKVTYRFDACSEALEDTGALVSEIEGQVPQEFAKYVENAMLNGAGPMTGVIGDANTATVAAEAGQTAGTIVAENVDKMFCSAKRPAASVWVVSRSAYCAIQSLEDSNGNRLFSPNVALSPFGTLKGLPIVVSDYAQAIGTVGDIVLGNFNKYDIVAKGGLRMASSAHVRFLEDASVFRFTYRVAGQPVGLLLTATDGTEVADFVELAARP